MSGLACWFWKHFCPSLLKKLFWLWALRLLGSRLRQIYRIGGRSEDGIPQVHHGERAPHIRKRGAR